MELELQRAEQQMQIALKGDFDASSTQGFREQVDSNLGAELTSCVVDMAQVEFIDSSAIGELVALFKRLDGEGRDLRLINVGGQPAEMFQFLRIDKVIPIEVIG